MSINEYNERLAFVDKFLKAFSDNRTKVGDNVIKTVQINKRLLL